MRTNDHSALDSIKLIPYTATVALFHMRFTKLDSNGIPRDFITRWLKYTDVQYTKTNGVSMISTLHEIKNV